MGFTCKVWNVKQFGDTASAARIHAVADFINRDGEPDVFAILEFQAKKAARKLISDHFAGYDFAITDSKRQLDYLIFWKRGRFD